MTARECYHCHEQIEEGAPHDCWTTSEENLTRNLSEDLMDAWERLRETAVDFGEQRVYARDEVESPITDWLHEAYEVSERLRSGRKQ